MHTPTKYRIAKELLIFLGCFFLGIVVIPLVVIFFESGSTYKDVLDSFFVTPQMGAWVIAPLCVLPADEIDYWRLNHARPAAS